MFCGLMKKYIKVLPKSKFLIEEFVDGPCVG